MPTKSFPTDKVAFIIPTLTNTAGLVNLLKDLEKYYSNSTVILVNNDGSSPLENKIDSKDFRLQLSFLNNPKNAGFARASNDGARRAEELTHPQYLVFLNDDIRFDTDWISTSISVLGKNNWSAVAPLLINKNGGVENYGYRVLPFGKIELIKRQEKQQPDGLTAAALIIQKKDFFALKGFDPIYFAYLEDVDLFLRAAKLGLRFGIAVGAKVLHEGQATSSHFKVRKAFLDFKNWNILIVKNWGFKKILTNLPQIITERMRNLWGIVKAA